MGLVIEPEQGAAAPLTHPIAIVHPTDDFAEQARHYTFFARTGHLEEPSDFGMMAA